MPILNRRKFLYLLSSIATVFMQKLSFAKNTPAGWETIRKIDMKGTLKAFWNVYGADNEKNQAQSIQHGFKLSSALNVYADYPGNQKENIYNFIKNKNHSPWVKPRFFERIVKRNLKEEANNASIFIHDIEFEFEKDIQKLWKDPELRKSSKVKNIEDFSEKYYQEWATWFSLPCQWSKQNNPTQPIGIYGPQIFNRDYWGFSKPSELEKSHLPDLKLWKYIDPYVDFYTSSAYVFYDWPDSIYYIASNVEENYRLGKKFSKKPLYVYLSLKYHYSNEKLAEQELADYLVEASAVVPFFTGAKGVVIWGWEPKSTGQYYEKLPIFMKSLSRISHLSAKISKAQLIVEQPAYELWQRKHPLVRKLKVSNDEWILMATNPWQDEHKKTILTTYCGAKLVELEINGKHTEIYHLQSGKLRKISI
jgi:hypothetical protein